MSLAAAFSELLQPNDVLALQGTLGAGKTCFVKGLARGLGVADPRQVISPTFVLMRRHDGRLPMLTRRGRSNPRGASESRCPQ